MNYFKKILIIFGITASFFVALTSTAVAGGTCSATGPTSAKFDLTGCPNPGHGALWWCDDAIWWNCSLSTGYTFCNNSQYLFGLTPGTPYSFRGFDSNNTYYASCSFITPGVPGGTVRIMPNIASAPWTITGPGTNQSGVGSINLNNKNAGIYSIVWGDAAGYTKSITTQSLSLANGGTITFSNTFTPITAPVLSSPTATSITTSSAVLGANIISNGGSGITSRGTCWGTTSPGTNCVAEGGTALGVFSHLRSVMPPGTMIYYRGYANNVAMGTGYSPVGTFTTLTGAAPPTLTSPTVTSITTSSAVLGANITSNGGAPITERGICWGTTMNPTTNCIPQGGTTTGIFTHLRTGLPTGSSIYYRGYATNSAGLTGYSSSGLFTTLWLDITAGATTPTTAIMTVPTTFSSTITKNGTTGTGTSFNTLFQFDDADHTVVSASQVVTTPAINVIPLGTAITSTSYTFPSGGTWYVRACADNDTAFVGTILEWQEGNNCGAWTPVTVSTITGTLNAPSCLISAGASTCTSNVSWSITNPVSPNSVRQNGVSFSTLASSAGTPRTISYSGPNTFTLYSNNGAALLATASPTASCTTGTSWNGSVCAVNPVFSCTGTTPTNAAIYAGDDTGLSANTPKSYNAVNTAVKCEYACNAGFSWNGSSCLASFCGDGICNGTDTLLTCPKDCKRKVIQF